ncbi:phosphohexomutase (phosphoglucomutase / phosphomannomutase) [Natrialba magadii ATCC 43099]|uniref:Phosphoglucosamine mutase n=1 Tax=Natrialba magadii (strain ATCC 43099 / DSM 3394 / CCM 3739 / CIP 104546 / IAM 13178 / JCM 8861 / NBRC 102185 / NCIMB 2190 / MS3) TaxID=547559 RepID=D3SVB8_NATMM|nr:phosphoglucomutase [Natrialba magadii]ADD05526.1 phosphohexomutase (phosphoglucomutase / phosphomannomutase) [Natrialba magadii ATCC 43099]ELY29512.1 phosphoglucosamine mutase [Natrialba magadii ATCC 43099]
MDAITFGTDGWRATLETFTTPRVRMVGQGVATYLADEGRDAPVVVGYDARESSRGFAEELARVLCANGFDVLLPERDCPTPLVAHAIVERDLAGGLAITASHNPPEYNGVKFIPHTGAPALPEVTDAIADRLAEPDPLPESEHGTVREVDLETPHADAVFDLVGSITAGDDSAISHSDTDSRDSTAGDTDSRDSKAGDSAPDDAIIESDFTVAYDAMHGSGRGVTDAALERAGLTVERLRCERDPDFGGGAPEPAAEHLTELIDRVTDPNSAPVLGLANDGDADRLAIVTPARGYLDENLFFAALYEYLLESDAGSAVRSVSTTYLIDRVAEAHAEAVHEVPVGFKWVAQAMADHDALVGGEESGGFTVRGHVREKDGVLVALLAAAMHAAEPIDDRVDRLLDTHGTVVQDKISVDCPDEEKGRVLGALESEIPETVAGTTVADVNTADGFKLLLEDGSWLLVRPSGTEPVLRVYAEAETDERVATLLDAGESLVEPLVESRG